MHRLVTLFAAVLFSCAAERTQLPPTLDPSNPDAPESPPYTVTERESLGSESHGSPETGGGHGAHMGPSDRIDGGTGAQGAGNDGAPATVCGHTRNDAGSSHDAHQKADDTPHQMESHDSHGVEPAHPTDAGTLIYVCPMHPEVTSATPGRCPKCGMKLVPEERK